MRISRYFILICAVMFCAVANAQDVKRGYRGFIEYDSSLTSWMVADSYSFDPESGVEYSGIHRKAFGEMALSTSHGYQFNPRFFVGLGLSGGYSGIHDGWFMGTYVHARTDQTFGKFTPYAELRFGLVTHAEGGLYISPAIGYRFNFGHRANLNLGVGMTLRHMGETDASSSHYYNNQGELIHITLGKDPVMKPYFTFRVGVDF